MPIIFFANISKFRSILLISFFLISTNSSFASPAECKLNNSDQLWIRKTLDLWEGIRQDSLKVSAKIPWLILFDESCVWHINPNLKLLDIDSKTKNKISFNKKSADIYVISHSGKIVLPDKSEIPSHLLSFAATYNKGKESFFVSSMPSIWRKAPHLKDEKNLEILIKSVFIHEITHTLHRNYYSKLEAFEKKTAKLGIEDFDDDIIQNIFERNNSFRESLEFERKLLEQAINEENPKTKNKLAEEVLNAIRNRRKQFFSNENAIYAEIEDTFLMMEGVANWAAYKAAMKQGLNHSDALKLIRRSGKYWSQDEGTVLLVLIDSLLPNWQKKSFGKQPVSVLDLLDKAVKYKL